MTMSIQSLQSILPRPVFSSIALTSSRHQNQGDTVMKLVLTTSTNYGKLIWDFYQTVAVLRDSQPVRLVQILIAWNGSRLTGLHTSWAAEFCGVSNLVSSSSICIWELELSSSTNYQTRICKQAELIHMSWATTNLNLVDLLNEPKNFVWARFVNFMMNRIELGWALIKSRLELLSNSSACLQCSINICRATAPMGSKFIKERSILKIPVLFFFDQQNSCTWIKKDKFLDLVPRTFF